MANRNNRGNDGEQYGSVERCSFCGLPITQVDVLFSGADGAAICDRCIKNGYLALAGQQKEQQKKHDGKGGILSCEKLIQTAIGQAGVFAIGNHIPAEPFCFPDGGGSQVIPKLLAGDPASGEQGVAF